MAKRILSDTIDRAIKELAKMRGITKEQLINEAVFWYLNFLGAKVEYIEQNFNFNLSEKTIEKIADAVVEKLKSKQEPQD